MSKIFMKTKFRKASHLRDCPQILYGFYMILYNFDRFNYWKKSFEIVFERKLKQLDTNLKGLRSGNTSYTYMLSFDASKTISFSLFLNL